MQYRCLCGAFFGDREGGCFEPLSLPSIPMTVLYSAIAIFSVSILGALLLSEKNRSPDQKQTRILLFGLYFWLLAFVQLIIYALIYYVLAK
jgi:hypothetical protein